MQHSDFEGMMVNPFAILKSENIFTDFALLDLHPEFKLPIPEKLILNRVIAFIACVYDMKSPLQTIDDVIRKKGEAAELCSFNKVSTGDNKYMIEYMDIIQGKNDVINKMIIAYCRMQGSHEWTQLCVYNDKFYEMILQLKDLTDPSEQKVTMANIQFIKKSFDEVKSDFLAHDTNKYLDKAVTDTIEFETLNLRPEHIAALMQKKDSDTLTVVNVKPFGKDYTFERHTDDVKDYF